MPSARHWISRKDACAARGNEIHTHLQSWNGVPLPRPEQLSTKPNPIEMLEADSWCKTTQKSGRLDRPVPTEGWDSFPRGRGGKTCSSSTAPQRQSEALPTVYLPRKLKSTLIFVSSPESVARAEKGINDVLARAGKTPWSERPHAEKKDYVVGLDSEWRPSFKKGVSYRTSILQVAFPALLLIFDLHWIFSSCSPPAPADAARAQALPPRVAGNNTDSFDTKVLRLLDMDPQRHTSQIKALLLLRRVLEAKGLLKIGFAFRGDLIKLCRDFKYQIASISPFIDVQEAVRTGAVAGELVGNKTRLSLESVVAARLGLRLCKKARMTDWEARPLSAQQLLYAATDAQLLVRIYEELGPAIAEKGAATPSTFACVPACSESWQRSRC